MPELQRPEQVFTFDSLGRLEQITNSVNSATTRFEYPNTNRVDTFTTIQTGLGEAQSFQITDGAGRVVAAAKIHPGSEGGFSGHKMIYDVMGRVIKTSNPTETSASGHPSQWNTEGDDAGWNYTEQTYDWKGRPLRTTHPDGTYKEAAYSSCGCAGSEVITFTDEGTLVNGGAKKRQQKIYSDVLGRAWKTEVLNWDGTGPNGTAPGNTVYSTTVTTFNVRDQVDQIVQYAGPEGSTTNQVTNMTYDGYGRLQTRHVPEQDVGTLTTWLYNADDTIQSITDARGAASTYTYNNGRHLPNTATHTLSGNTPIIHSFAYDAVGNRTSMSDSSGGTSYQYNALAQLTSETRTFSGLAENYTLSYEYGLAGQLTSLTDHTNQRVNYGYDKIGRLNSLTGTNYSFNAFINDVSYRAWGEAKEILYGNGRKATVDYNSRLQPTHFEIPAGGGFGAAMSFNYEYYNDGRLKFSGNVLDSRFDRSYEYNHGARLTKALSGAEARGEPATTNRPYKETATYDEFGHLKTRSSLHWSRTLGFGSADTYANNRRIGWSYDVDGNWLTGAGRQHAYDAAGRNITITWTSGSVTHQFYDGDNQRVKANQQGGEATYYLRSTVLGGQVIEELDSTGAKETGYLFVGEKLIGHQLGTGGVSLLYTEPSGVTTRFTHGSGSLVGNWLELDPWGAEVYSADPYVGDPGFSGGRGEGGPVFPGVGDISMPSTGCSRMLDGVLTSCDLIDRLGNGLGLELVRRNANGTTERFSMDTMLGVMRVWHPAKSGNSSMVIDCRGNECIARTNNMVAGFWEFVSKFQDLDDAWDYKRIDPIGMKTPHCSIRVKFSGKNKFFKKTDPEKESCPLPILGLMGME